MKKISATFKLAGATLLVALLSAQATYADVVIPGPGGFEHHNHYDYQAEQQAILYNNLLALSIIVVAIVVSIYILTRIRKNKERGNC